MASTDGAYSQFKEYSIVVEHLLPSFLPSAQTYSEAAPGIRFCEALLVESLDWVLDGERAETCCIHVKSLSTYF